MKSALQILPLLCAALFIGTVAAAADPRPRLIVMTDIGHDPDDEQQIVHLLVCANEVEIEGLIPTTGRFFRPNPTDSTKWLMPHLLHAHIDGY
ncbi:MAG: nucleoside hydrolase-like domain-containing protein, partial [Opitutaceae bacterium]